MPYGTMVIKTSLNVEYLVQNNIMKRVVRSIGFTSGIVAFTATISYCIVQLLQLYDMLSYPMDERLIYGTSLCIVVPFLLEILALHYTIPQRKKFWSHGALCFTILYAVFVTANYVVQLATVIPETLKGNLAQVRILQQTPHSLFWNFDALGYIFMGFATAMAIPIFNKSGLEKWVRISLIANTLVTPLIAIVYFYPDFSYKLLILGFPWAVTAPASMLLLALMFRKRNHVAQKETGKDSFQTTSLRDNNGESKKTGYFLYRTEATEFKKKI